MKEKELVDQEKLFTLYIEVLRFNNSCTPEVAMEKAKELYNYFHKTKKTIMGDLSD